LLKTATPRLSAQHCHHNFAIGDAVLEIAAGWAAAGCGSCGSQDTIANSPCGRRAARATPPPAACSSADYFLHDSISQ
jgi:hypothetical protein